MAKKETNCSLMVWQDPKLYHQNKFDSHPKPQPASMEHGTASKIIKSPSALSFIHAYMHVLVLFLLTSKT